MFYKNGVICEICGKMFYDCECGDKWFRATSLLTNPFENNNIEFDEMNDYFDEFDEEEQEAFDEFDEEEQETFDECFDGFDEKFKDFDKHFENFDKLFGKDSNK